MKNSFWIFICLLSILSSCKLEKVSQIMPKSKLQMAKPSTYQKTGCYCLNDFSSCPSCVRDFMAGLNTGTNTKRYYISWVSCVGPSGSQIGGFSNSYIDFCVENTPGNQCSKLCAVLHNPPSWLPCLFDGMILEMAIGCNSTGGYTVSTIANGIDWDVLISVQGDPKINVTCQGSNGESWNCIGDFYD